MGLVMASPAKILLLMICVAALMSYFGDKFIMVTDNIGAEKAQNKTGQGAVYKQVYMTDSGGDIRIPMSRDGHYWVTLDVNGTPLRFMVDTGASHMVLSYEAAASVGLDPQNLPFNRAVRTANGVGYQAVVKLDRVNLDSIEVSGIYASITEPGRMEISLLGMNFLNKLSGFTVEGKELILKP